MGSESLGRSFQVWVGKMHSETTADWDWDSVLLLANLPWDSEGRSDSGAGNTSEANPLPFDQGSNKKDPRLSCPNFLAGRVPCACTDNEEENQSEGDRKRVKSPARCQVPGCGASLEGLKGYHKRHRVCLACANSRTVLLESGPHRYCQQCGKFHVLSDFDEGKRSCRRKLERHNNRRRRKISDLGSMEVSQSSDKETKSGSIHLNDGSEAGVDGKSTSSALIEHGNMDNSATRDVQTDEQDSGLTRSAGAVIISGDVESLEPLQNKLPFREHPGKVLGSSPVETQAVEMHGPQSPSFALESRHLTGSFSSATFDVNDEFPARNKSGIGEHSLLELLTENRMELENPHCQRSPSEGHFSEVGRAAYPSTSSSSAFRRHSTYISPCPTRRISFKFYDWNPADFPRRLRQQILEWLANMPVELEGYIRSGCTILSLFIAMSQTSWDKVSADWRDQILQLVWNSESGFWNKGVLVARLGYKVSEVENGKVSLTVLDDDISSPRLYHVHPLCLEAGVQADIAISGYNLPQKNGRLVISSAGKCVSQEVSESIVCKRDSFLVTHSEGSVDNACSLCIPFLAPSKFGCAYVEVDGPFGTSDFLPILIADKEICSEIRTLEEEDCISCTVHKSLDLTTRSLLLDLGWVLRLNNQGITGIHVADHLERLHLLFMFSVGRGWCATSTRLLQAAKLMGFLENIGLCDDGFTALHLAVLHNHVNLAKLFMRVGSEYEEEGGFGPTKGFWWHEDFPGPKKVTPLHIVGQRKETGSLVEVMTKTERGLLAWEQAKDCSGKSPSDYANLVCTSYSDIVHQNGLLVMQSIGSSGKMTCDEFSSLSRKRIPVQSVLVLEEQTSFSGKVFDEMKEETPRRKLHFPSKHFRGLLQTLSTCNHIEMMGTRCMVATTVSILVICAGVCIVFQHPNQIVQISMSLRRCLGSQMHF